MLTWLGAALLLAGCEKMFELDKYEVEIDTSEPGTIDYWVDGYCPGVEGGSPVPASDDCGNITDVGCCDGRGNLVYCAQGRLYCNACAADYDAACSWNVSYYDCTPTDQGPDPGGAPRACADLP